MKKLSDINEGMFAGAVIRSKTGEVRKEDDVNLMNPEGIFQYIKDKYYRADNKSDKFVYIHKTTANGVTYERIHMVISGDSIATICSVDAIYKNEVMKDIRLGDRVMITYETGNFIDDLKKKYDVKEHMDDEYLISKNIVTDKAVTNADYIDIIDGAIDADRNRFIKKK